LEAPVLFFVSFVTDAGLVAAVEVVLVVEIIAACLNFNLSLQITHMYIEITHY
jgi:hypothetical protein